MAAVGPLRAYSQRGRERAGCRWKVCDQCSINAIRPAVHIDRVRGHKFASIGANEQNQFADLLRLAEALRWYIVEELFNRLGRGLRRQQQISENLLIVVFVALPKRDIEPKGRD
jgi:hypothetical protein